LKKEVDARCKIPSWKRVGGYPGFTPQKILGLTTSDEKMSKQKPVCVKLDNGASHPPSRTSEESKKKRAQKKLSRQARRSRRMLKGARGIKE